MPAIARQNVAEPASASLLPASRMPKKSVFSPAHPSAPRRAFPDFRSRFVQILNGDTAASTLGGAHRCGDPYSSHRTPQEGTPPGFDSPAYSRTKYGLTWCAVFDGGPASEGKILRRRLLGYFRTKRMLLLWNDRSGRRSQLITRQRPLIHI